MAAQGVESRIVSASSAAVEPCDIPAEIDREFTGGDLQRCMAERGLELHPSDRDPILAIVNFLQRAALRLVEYDGAPGTR